MNEELIERINLLPRAQAVSVGDSVFTSEQRQLIAEAYKTLLGKDIPNCSCRHRYSDALIEICFTFKISSNMKTKYQLKAGVIIWLGTECYNNHNLTDEVAKEYLKRYPEAREKEFQAWPEEPQEPDNHNAVMDEARKCLEESKGGLVEYESEITEESVASIVACQNTLEEVIAGGDINSVIAAENGLKQAWKNAEKKAEEPTKPASDPNEDTGSDNGEGEGEGEGDSQGEGNDPDEAKPKTKKGK